MTRDILISYFAALAVAAGIVAVVLVQEPLAKAALGAEIAVAGLVLGRALRRIVGEP